MVLFAFLQYEVNPEWLMVFAKDLIIYINYFFYDKKLIIEIIELFYLKGPSNFTEIWFSSKSTYNKGTLKTEVNWITYITNSVTLIEAWNTENSVKFPENPQNTTIWVNWASTEDKYQLQPQKKCAQGTSNQRHALWWHKFQLKRITETRMHFN